MDCNGRCELILTDCNVTGTTCATVLTRSIFTEGCKSVAAGMNAMDLRRGINMAVDSVVEHLKSRAKMISTSEEIAQVVIIFQSINQNYFNPLTLNSFILIC